LFQVLEALVQRWPITGRTFDHGSQEHVAESHGHEERIRVRAERDGVPLKNPWPRHLATRHQSRIIARKLMDRDIGHAR
jgi:hypothetical protein